MEKQTDNSEYIARVLKATRTGLWGSVLKRGFGPFNGMTLEKAAEIAVTEGGKEKSGQDKRTQNDL